jgi:hypothetical protein
MKYLLLFLLPFIGMSQDYDYMTVDGEIMNLVFRMYPGKVYKKDFWFSEGPGKDFTYDKLVVVSGKAPLADFQAELEKFKSDQQIAKDLYDDNKKAGEMYRNNPAHRGKLVQCRDFINGLDPENLLQSDYKNILRCFVLKIKRE